MASPRELVKQRRDAIPGRVRVVARVLRRQSIKCPYTGAGAWTTCVQVPSGEADPARGGVEPSSEADPARGAVEPSSEADPARGGVKASSKAELARASSPRASGEANLTRGGIRRATLAGRGGLQGRDRVACVL
jgi:hypothetical protein